MVKKQIMTLPNPDAERLPVVEQCMGGQKYEVMEKGKRVTKVVEQCDKVFDNVCIAYYNPTVKFETGGCPLASNKVQAELQAQKKLNPIKSSKRKGR